VCALGEEATLDQTDTGSGATRPLKYVLDVSSVASPTQMMGPGLPCRPDFRRPISPRDQSHESEHVLKLPDSVCLA
jgi:hypothetical protein